MSRSETREILLMHAEKYPKMRPTDAVKLLFQAEFGGGHMISDRDACIKRLCTEHAETPSGELPLTEPIGKGMLRVNLGALDRCNVTPEELAEAFIRSASEKKGNLSAFKESLCALTELTEEGAFAFGGDELSAYLCEYESAGFPAVSHSEEYREAYHPSYRVVLESVFRKEG